MPGHIEFQLYKDNRRGPRQRLSVRGPRDVVDAALNMDEPDHLHCSVPDALITRQDSDDGLSRLLINSSTIGRYPEQTKQRQVAYVKAVIGAFGALIQQTPVLADPRLQLVDFCAADSGLFHLDARVDRPKLVTRQLERTVRDALITMSYGLNAYCGQSSSNYQQHYHFRSYGIDQGSLAHDDRGNSSFYRHRDWQPQSALETSACDHMSAQNVMRDDESPLIFLAGAVALARSNELV